MPYTLGDSELDQDLIDLAVEVTEDLPTPAIGPEHEHAERIAELVAGLVEDGSTLQLGIGQVPDATLRALAGRRRLAIWSEMVSDGVMDLDRGGALDPARPITCSFLFGSPELYEWVDQNPRLRMTRTETTNDPSRIAAHPAMISVNTALQVDLSDQAGASHIGGRLYSGFGGQPDFVEGALHSPGGHAVIALRSWHERSDSSTIVPRLDRPGDLLPALRGQSPSRAPRTSSGAASARRPGSSSSTPRTPTRASSYAIMPRRLGLDTTLKHPMRSVREPAASPR